MLENLKRESPFRNCCSADIPLELFLKRINLFPPAIGTSALSFGGVLVPTVLVCFAWRISLEIEIWIPNELRNIFFSYS